MTWGLCCFLSCAASTFGRPVRACGCHASLVDPGPHLRDLQHAGARSRRPWAINERGRGGTCLEYAERRRLNAVRPTGHFCAATVPGGDRGDWTAGASATLGGCDQRPSAWAPPARSVAGAALLAGLALSSAIGSGCVAWCGAPAPCESAWVRGRTRSVKTARGARRGRLVRRCRVWLADGDG